MSRHFLHGTALAVLVAAAPAAAQDANQCRLAMAEPDAIVANARAIDADADGTITEAEYNACLDTNSVAADQRQSFLDEFDGLVAGPERIILIADLERDAPAQQEGQAAQIAVAQPAPDVNVVQPAPTVAVTPAAPQVAVDQAAPQVAVDQAEPQVSVEQAQPEVSVTQPEPQVEVQQGEAQVAITQPEAQIEVDAPAPAVEVQQAMPNVEVEQNAPQVSVDQLEPEVRVETAEANVDVMTEEPNVVINQAEPQVEIQRVIGTGPAAPEAQAAAPDADATETQTAQADPTPPLAPAAPAQPTGQSALAIAVPFDELEGATAYNEAGDEIGEINDVVRQTASGDLYVVVSAGGFLGLGDSDVVFPYGDVAMVDDRVVIATPLTADTVEEREDYDASAYEEATEPAAQ